MVRGDGLTYVRAPDGLVTDERQMRLAQKITAVAVLIEEASWRGRIVAYTGSGNTGQNVGCVYYKGAQVPL